VYLNDIVYGILSNRQIFTGSRTYFIMTIYFDMHLLLGVAVRHVLALYVLFASDVHHLI